MGVATAIHATQAVILLTQILEELKEINEKLE
jgi:hypothetical protein